MYNYIAHENLGYFAKDTRVSVTKRLDRQPHAQAGINIHNDGRKDLISYSTLVCTVDKDGWLTCRGLYSKTTRCHISSFIREVAPNFSYYDAKRCYENDEAINIYTGEIISLADYAKMQG